MATDDPAMVPRWSWTDLVGGQVPALDDPPAWGRLAIRCGAIELRTPAPEDIEVLVERVRHGGLDDEAARGGLGPWTVGTRADVADDVGEHLQSSVAGLDITTPTDADWFWPAVVVLDGVPIGRQDAKVRGSAAGWTVHSGSWLLNTHRGHGFGAAARTALLAATLRAGAVRATTSWRPGNAASERVSLRLGYVVDGPVQKEWPDGRRMEEIAAHLEPPAFQPVDRVDIGFRG